MKQFNLSESIISRPVTVFMVTLMVVGFGLFALTKLKVTMYPPFNIPILAVSAGYRNVSPEDIQRILVEPIEAAVSATEGIETLESSSRKGSSFVILRMKPGTDIRKAELKVRESIDRIRNQIPREANNPIIFQFDPETRPIMNLSVQSDNRGLDELRNMAVEFIEPRLERLKGVAAADTKGGLERSIYVNLDQEKLALHKLLPQDVETAIRTNNVQIPVGNVLSDKQNLGVRAISMYTSSDQIEQTIVKISETGIPIRVRDVAFVDDGFAQISTLVEVNGKNTVTIDIQKQSDANTLDVTQAIEAAIPEIEDRLPDGVSISILRNNGGFIETAVQNLANSAVQALVVVVIILVLFMGGWRIALIVATSIPISMTATFAIMYFSGLTLNIFSITGLALAIGLLVDNSIVVSESISTKLEEGLSRLDAAIQGTNEVIGALIGATLTTLGVFVPLLGLSGFSGVVATNLALTICIAISISFLASIVLIPVLSSLFLKKMADSQKAGRMFKAIHLLERGYGKTLGWLLYQKKYVVIAILMILTGSYFLNKAIPGGTFPETDSGELDIDVTLPTGTKLAVTAEVIREFAKVIQKNPEVKNVVTSIGQRRWSQETNSGEISVTLFDMDKRKKSTNDIAMMYRRMLEKPGVDVRVSVSGGGGFGRGGNWGGGGGVRVTLFGSDVQVLQALSKKIEDIVMLDTSVISVENPRVDPTPELHFNPDRQRLSRMGAGISEVANAFKTQTRGTLVGEFRSDGREIPIEVRTSETAVKSRYDLQRIPVYQTGDVRVPVAAVGEFSSYKGIDRISRRDRETMLDVSVSVKGNPIEFTRKFKEIMETQVPMPDGYRYDFTGANMDFQQSGSELIWALLTALLLTYMIMASQFENFRDPFVVMFTIPLAFFGSLLLLFISDTAMYVPATIGIVLLVGIVVNNGIVLIDYIHRYTESSVDDFDYVKRFISAAQRRLRPIMLTALTTICSMIPLALELGAGAETWSPLARSVIGGLAFSSVLSLFVVPVLTVLFSKRRRTRFTNATNLIATSSN